MGMEIDWKPNAAKGDDAVFSGSIKMRVPTFSERYEYMESAGFEIGEDGAVEANMKQMGAIRRLVEKSKAHYGAVDLTRVSDGKKFSSYEEMETDPACDPIIIEFAMACMTGVQPGKN
jgi:hypothetical protein